MSGATICHTPNSGPDSNSLALLRDRGADAAARGAALCRPAETPPGLI